MMWRDVIELGNATETITNGEVIQTFTYRTVYANKKGVRLSEFYKAGNAGLKPELTFEVRSEEFNNDEKLKFEDKEYSVIRKYDRGEITELTVEAYIGGEV